MLVSCPNLLTCTISVSPRNGTAVARRMKSATKVRKKFHHRMTGYGTEDTKPIKSAKK